MDRNAQLKKISVSSMWLTFRTNSWGERESELSPEQILNAKIAFYGSFILTMKTMQNIEKYATNERVATEVLAAMIAEAHAEIPFMREEQEALNRKTLVEESKRE